MSGRPRKACDHCNLQKVSSNIPSGSCHAADTILRQVRCSGHRPSCQRCLRTSRPCVYGKPGHAQTVSANTAAPYHRDDRSFSVPQQNITEKSYVGIPSALISVLVELYFSHVYNSSLLLHKPTFLQNLATGTVRPQVLLSVCAFATKYASAAFMFSPARLLHKEYPQTCTRTFRAQSCLRWRGRCTVLLGLVPGLYFGSMVDVILLSYASIVLSLLYLTGLNTAAQAF